LAGCLLEGLFQVCWFSYGFDISADFLGCLVDPSTLSRCYFFFTRIGSAVWIRLCIVDDLSPILVLKPLHCNFYLCLCRPAFCFNSHDINDIKCTPCFLRPGANNILLFRRCFYINRGSIALSL
jgi:hypothetical protein